MRVLRGTLLLLTLMASVAVAQWSSIPYPGEFDNIDLFLPCEEAIYAGTGMGKVYQSTNLGATWHEIGGELDGDYAPVTGLARLDNTMFMSRTFPGQENYRSTFNGYEWSPWEPIGYQGSTIWHFAVVDNSLFAILGNGKIHRSDDLGTTWTPVTEPAYQVWEIFTYEGRLFASEDEINGGDIFRSDDMGQTWTSVGVPLGSSYACSHTYYQNELLICVYHMGGVGTFWRSTDFGDSWTQITTLPTSANINGMTIADDGRLAIGASGSGGGGVSGTIFLSDDFINWEDYTGDLPQGARPVNPLWTHDGYFFKTGGSVTTYRGVHPQNSGIDEELVASDLTIFSVHPNPFSPAATVRFSLESSKKVVLNIFDLAGRHVTTLRNETMPAGSHSVTWHGRDANGRDVPAGVYWAMLRDGQSSKTQKIIRTH